MLREKIKVRELDSFIIPPYCIESFVDGRQELIRLHKDLDLFLTTKTHNIQRKYLTMGMTDVERSYVKLIEDKTGISIAYCDSIKDFEELAELVTQIQKVEGTLFKEPVIKRMRSWITFEDFSLFAVVALILTLLVEVLRLV